MSTRRLSELNRSARVDVRANDHTATSWLNSARKLFEKGDDYFRLRDNEEAYVHYMKATTIVVETLRDHKDFAFIQRQASFAELSRKTADTMSRLEALKEYIKKKYADELPAKTASTTSSAKSSALNAVYPADLAKLLQRQRTETLLILDVRARDEYENVRFQQAEPRVIVLNILPEWLTARTSSIEFETTIAKHLLPQKAVHFRNRNKFDLVVYHDHASTKLGAGGAIDNLVGVIWEREFEKPLRKMPVLLIGGIRRWVEENNELYLERSTRRGGSGSSGGGGTTLPLISQIRGSGGALSNAQSPVTMGYAKDVSSFLSTKATFDKKPPPPVSAIRSDSTAVDNVARKLSGTTLAETRVVGSHLEPHRPTTASSIFDDPNFSMQLMSATSNRRPSTAKIYPQVVDGQLSSEKIAYPSLPERSTSFEDARKAIQRQQEAAAAAAAQATQPRKRTPPPIPVKPTTLIQQIGAPPLKPAIQTPLIPVPGSSTFYNNAQQQPPPIPSAPSRSSSSSSFGGLLRDNSQNSLSTRPPPLDQNRLHRQTTRPSISIPRSSSPSGSSNSPTLFFAPPLPSKNISMDLNLKTFSYGQVSNSIGMKGLKNLGNTCYMNSILQSLTGTIPLIRFFLDGTYRVNLNKKNPLGTKGIVAEAFADIVKEIWQDENQTVLNPAKFKESICTFARQFKGTEQHDSQEFLSFLMDGLHEDLNVARLVNPDVKPDKVPDDEDERYPDETLSRITWDRYLKMNRSIIVDLFQGQLRNQLTCGTCGKTSVTYNPFMYLSLPIPSSRSRVSLFECLDSFVEAEMLDGSDAWHCSRCKTPRKSKKQLTVSKLPNILIIHLKRFFFSGPFRNKVDSLVDFPIRDLDLTAYMPKWMLSRGEGPYVYDLYAVSNHFGGLNGGHYTANVRNGHRNQWFCFDDVRVSRIDQVEREVVNKAAYILFYVRKM